MSLNKVLLIGRVGQDPETRKWNETTFASFTLATSERYKDRNGDPHEVTEWHDITCSGKLAEVVEKYVEKGRQVYVEGSIRTRQWETQEGEKRRIREVRAEHIELLGNKPQEQGSGSGTFQGKRPQAEPRITGGKPQPKAQSLEPQVNDLPF
jgi:single-strand DNA-binding protein